MGIWSRKITLSTQCRKLIKPFLTKEISTRKIDLCPKNVTRPFIKKIDLEKFRKRAKNILKSHLKFCDFRRYFILKIIYFEKATNFCEISTIDLSYVVTVKSTVEILQSFSHCNARIKSVHSKKPVTRISFLSKLWYFQ